MSMFWIVYFLSPRYCHKFVGYLEEEAVKTYTHCIEVHTPFYMTASSISEPVAHYIIGIVHTAESGQGGTEDVGEYKSSSDCCLLLETACKPVYT